MKAFMSYSYQQLLVDLLSNVFATHALKFDHFPGQIIERVQFHCGTVAK